MSSLRIISYNVNGIRAAMKKGLIEWLTTDPADIICIQETKAHRDNVAHQLITAWDTMTIGSLRRRRVTAV
jgi:exodeoxyribonuclease-3